jgi:hypothetical protein
VDVGIELLLLEVAPLDPASELAQGGDIGGADPVSRRMSSTPAVASSITASAATRSAITGSESRPPTPST